MAVSNVGRFAGRNIVSMTAVTVSSAATTLTVPGAAARALISVETDSVRFDETGAAASAGHLLYAGDTLNYLDANYRNVLKKIAFIRVTNDATVRISFYD